MEFIYNTKDNVKFFDSEEKKQGDVTLCTFIIEFEEELSPSEFTIGFCFPMRDVNGIWTPSTSETTEIRPRWGKRYANSAIASGMPLIAGFGADGTSRFTLALSDVKRPCAIGCGVVEETGEAEVRIRLFTSLVKPLKKYTVTLRFDTKPLTFAKSIMSVKDWWTNDVGIVPCPVPEAAKHPVYSTWYNFHHAFTFDAMMEELKIAKSLGFDTVIIDGGWYHESTERGAIDSGDFKPAKSKVGLGHEFADACHALGIKVIFWFGVSFMGMNAENHKLLEGKYLYDSNGFGTSIIDPRFAEVRKFCVEQYVKAMIDLRLDGLKLDFVDMFRLKPESSKNYDEMDIPVLEDAVTALMSEIYDALVKVNPEVMIEFRQPYVGPAICAFGNMLRVYDCPYSGRTNSRSAADLRLVSGKTAIHTDMTMWEKGTTVTDAARQLYLGLFAVPQISVMLREVPAEQLAVVRRFLEYWNTNRDLILDGEFDCSTPLGTYEWMSSKADDKEIRLLITENASVMSTGLLDLINVTGRNRIYLDLTDKIGDYLVRITDCTGEKSNEYRINGGSVHKLNVTDAGIAHIEKIG